MKKYMLFLFAGMLIFSFVPNQLSAATTPVTATADPAQSQIVIASRLNEIAMTDQSEMTRDQKKELRQEKNSLTQSMRGGSGGIYISVGALLILILILIILF